MNPVPVVVAAGSKFCRGCETVKPVEEFARKPGRNGKPSRAARCKDCAREWAASYRVEHGDRVKANSRRAYASDPSRKKASKGAYRDRNRDRILAERRAGYQLAYSERPEIWHAAKARRKSRLAVRMDAVDRLLSALYRRAIRDDPCFYCGRRVPDDMHDDHFFPLAKGGTDHWWNLVRACGPCNRRKYATCGTRFILAAGGSGESRLAPAVA